MSLEGNLRLSGILKPGIHTGDKVECRQKTMFLLRSKRTGDKVDRTGNNVAGSVDFVAGSFNFFCIFMRAC